MSRRVAIVSLGRATALGEVRRVASWRLLFEAAGADVEEVRLTPDRRPHLDGIGAVVAGSATPERLAWSGAKLRDHLARIDPAAVIVVSARAFDPAPLTGAWTLVLDLVDSLSRSYRDRSEIATARGHRYAYRSLAAGHRRVERKLGLTSTHLVAAGWADAHRLGAEWVPIVSDPSLQRVEGVDADHDVLFFGTLRYPPNVDALERLARLWPAVRRARPGTTALIAGAAPTTRVRELCATHHWELKADFSSLPIVAARARVAVAPLVRTAGIQIKLLDAASLGLAQVVTPEALEGYAPDFPIEPHSHEEGFALELVRLLDDPAAARAQAANTSHHVHERYTAEAWAEWAHDRLRVAQPAF